MATTLVGFILALQVLAAVAYAIAGDWPRVVYWTGASILISATLVMK